MISDAHLATEEQLLFSRPEVLQQLRDQLFSLVNQDTLNLEQLLQGLYEDILPIFNNIEHTEQSNVLKLMNCLNQFSQQSKERSNNIGTLANLAIKMIDYIRQKEENCRHIKDNYEQEVDSLKSTIDFLTNKNDIIENDVQIFKNQLQAAQNELQQIVGEREQENQNYLFISNEAQMTKEKEKDWKIQTLETELERIREQLHFYKFHSRSQKSHLKLIENTGIDEIRSEKSSAQKPQKINRVNLEEELYKSSNLISWLQQQNQMLKKEIMELQEFKMQKQQHNYQILLSDHIVENDQSVRGSSLKRATGQINILPIQVQENQRHLLRTASFTLLQRISSFTKLKQSNSSYKLHQQPQKDQVVSPPQDKCSPMNGDNKFHALNSDWSSKSFEVNFNNVAYQNLNPPKLIFLNQDQDDPSNEKAIKVISASASQARIAQQTRETQNSVKEFQHETNTLQKIYCNIGINTMNSIAQKEQMTWKDVVLNTITSNYIYRTLSHLVITGRIQRSKSKVKNMMHKFIY